MDDCGPHDRGCFVLLCVLVAVSVTVAATLIGLTGWALVHLARHFT